MQFAKTEIKNRFDRLFERRQFKIWSVLRCEIKFTDVTDHPESQNNSGWKEPQEVT